MQTVAANGATAEQDYRQTATSTLPPTPAVDLSRLSTGLNTDPSTGSGDVDRNWALGCEQCQYGLINPPAWKGTTIAESILAAYRVGDLTFCDCGAGAAKLTWLMKQDGDYETDGQQIERVRQEHKTRQVNKFFTDAGVPPKFQQLTWDSFKQVAGSDPGKEDLIMAIEAYLSDSQVTSDDGRTYYGIFVHGDSDQGKTGALSQLFLHYLHQGCSGLWVQYNTLLQELRNFGDGNVDERINQCKMVEYLFIDDFGDPMAKESSSYSRDVLMQIIDHRNSYGKAMFVTSNLSLDMLAKQYHQRLVKRMMESCFVVQVAGKPLGVLGKGRN